jgi:hypothetical protein
MGGLGPNAVVIRSGAERCLVATSRRSRTHPVPENKSDFRLRTRRSTGGTPPLELRVSKTVRGSDDSVYTFFLPGMVPNPLKLSAHPFGEIQLKAKGAGLIARLDKDRLIAGLKSGAADSAISKFLNPKLPRARAEGMIMRANKILGPPVLPDAPLEDHDLDIERMLEAMIKVEIADVSKLGQAMSVLREDGLLPPRAMLLLEVDGSRAPIIFLSLLDEPLAGTPGELPVGFPLQKTIRALLDSLRDLGGIVFTQPSEAELLELAGTVGLGDLSGGLRRIADQLDSPDVEARVTELMHELVRSLAGSIDVISRAAPVRPLERTRTPRQSRPPPKGGWVRPRPRRRGHTAPLVEAN